MARKEASTLILLANPSGAEQSVKVRVPAEVKKLRGLNGATIPLKGGAAELRLGPNETLGLIAER